MSGSRHIEFLLNNKLIKPSPSKILDELYAGNQRPFDVSTMASTSKPLPGQGIADEQMILHKADGKRIATTLGISELDVELDRAVWQVEKDISAKKELEEEAAELQKSDKENKEKR